MAIYLTQESDHPYLWLVPDDAAVQLEKGVTLLRTPSAVVAIWPINAGPPRPDAALTQRARVSEKTNKKTGEVTTQPRWDHAIVLRSDRQDQGVYGFAVEVYTGQDRGGFIDQAKQRRPETDERAVRGAVAMTAVSGKRVRLQWGNTLDAIGVWRDGKKRDWDSETNKALFHTIDGDLIALTWQGDGNLRINAGGRRFTCTVDCEGGVRFSE